MMIRFKSAKLKMAAVAACALAIAGIALPSHPAIARSANSVIPNIASGQIVDMVVQTTVVSTFHYQAYRSLTCGGTNCQGDFPPVATNRRLNVTRVSCYVGGAAASTYYYGDIELRTATNTVLLAEHLPVDSSNPSGTFLLNRAVDLQIPAGQHMHVLLLLENGSVISGDCSATGILSTLG